MVTLVSACLLGENCKYNGGNNDNIYVKLYLKDREYVAFCPEIAGGLNCLFVFAIIVSVGMSLGGLTGYAINPVRDFGPRVVYALLPMQNKAPTNWRYAWVPVLGPIVGALAAVGLYKVFPWP